MAEVTATVQPPSLGAAMFPASHDLPRPRADAGAHPGAVLAGRRHLLALPGHRAAPDPSAAGTAPADRVVRRAGRVHIGASVGTATALRSEPVRSELPLVAAALSRSCRPPVRDRETVVGSLCCADPASALTAAAVALDAEFTVEDAGGGTAVVPAAEFFLDPLRVALPPGATVVDVSFPVAGPGSEAGLHQLSRSTCGAAHVAAAVQLTVADGAVTEARVAVAAAGCRPVRMAAVEFALAGRPLTGDRLRTAARLADAAARDTARGAVRDAARRLPAPRCGRDLTVVVARALRAAAGLAPAR